MDGKNPLELPTHGVPGLHPCRRYAGDRAAVGMESDGDAALQVERPVESGRRLSWTNFTIRSAISSLEGVSGGRHKHDCPEPKGKAPEDP